MAAPRAVQFIALRNLARAGQQVRHLHMTGPATYASPVLAKEPLVEETSRSRAISSEIRSFNVTASPSKPATRQFNTSRALRANNDSSTIDFYYLPSMENLDVTSSPTDAQVRVPIIPTLNASSNTHARRMQDADEAGAAVMKPQISTASADVVFAPVADISDDHAMHVDFHAAADRLAGHLRRISAPVEKQAGMVGQIWTDMVDDILGGLNKRQAKLAPA